MTRFILLMKNLLFLWHLRYMEATGRPGSCSRCSRGNRLKVWSRRWRWSLNCSKLLWWRLMYWKLLDLYYTLNQPPLQFLLILSLWRCLCSCWSSVSMPGMTMLLPPKFHKHYILGRPQLITADRMPPGAGYWCLKLQLCIQQPERYCWGPSWRRHERPESCNTMKPQLFAHNNNSCY